MQGLPGIRGTVTPRIPRCRPIRHRRCRRRIELINSVNPAFTGQEASAINLVLTGGSMPAEEVSLIQDFYDATAKTEADLRDAFGLAASAPSYQNY